MADVLIRAQFDDGGATTGLGRLGATMDRLERTGATRGLRQVETGLQMLAAQAVGVSGPLGRVAEGLLRFGAGGEIALAAAAGIGLIAGALSLMNAATEGATESWSKLNKELASTSGGAVAKLAADLGDVRDRLADLQQPGFMENLLGGAAFVVGGKGLEDATRGSFLFEKRRRDEATARTMLGLRGAQLGPLDLANSIAQATNAVANGPTIGPLPNVPLPSVPTPTTPISFAQDVRAFLAHLPSAKLLEARALAEEGVSGPEDAFAQLMAMRAGIPWNMLDNDTKALFRQYGTQVVKNLDDTTKEPSTGAIVGPIAQALSSLALGIKGGGGIGGALSGVGGAFGALSAIKGLAGLGPIGLGLSAIGAIAGLFTHAKPAIVMIDGYSSTAITQQQQVMQLLAGFLGLKIDIISAGSATGDAAAYELGRRARLDGGMRLPPGALAAA